MANEVIKTAEEVIEKAGENAIDVTGSVNDFAKAIVREEVRYYGLIALGVTGALLLVDGVVKLGRVIKQYNATKKKAKEVKEEEVVIEDNNN